MDIGQINNRVDGTLRDNRRAEYIVIGIALGIFGAGAVVATRVNRDSTKPIDAVLRLLFILASLVAPPLSMYLVIAEDDSQFLIANEKWL